MAYQSQGVGVPNYLSIPGQKPPQGQQQQTTNPLAQGFAQPVGQGDMDPQTTQSLMGIAKKFCA